MPRREGCPPLFFGGENPVNGRLENRFLAPSRIKFFTPEHSGDAGNDGEGGANRESATASLVTAGGGASGDGGRGGFRDMVYFDYFFAVPMLFFWREGGKIRKRAKIGMYPRAYKPLRL